MSAYDAAGSATWTHVHQFIAYVARLWPSSLADVPWSFVSGLIIAIMYHSRHRLMSTVSKTWAELEGDVKSFGQRHFPAASARLISSTTASEKEDISPSVVAATTIISTQDLDVSRKLQAQLNQMQEILRKEKAVKAKLLVNFVRSRQNTSGVVFRSGTWMKLQNQLAETRKALDEEIVEHQDTKDFLEHQSNGRADAEELVEELKARMEEAELNQNATTQLATIDETEEESPVINESSATQTEESDGAILKAQIERLEKQLEVEQANYQFVFTKKEVFRHGGKNLKKELEDLQAEYNVLEDSRDTWKETCEALEEQTDVKVVRALRDQMDNDNAQNERRIGALETQLGIEKNAREEAQGVVTDLRERNTSLEHELEEAKAIHENLKAESYDFDGEYGKGKKPSAKGDEYVEHLEKLKAEYHLIMPEIEEIDTGYEAELHAQDSRGNHDGATDDCTDDGNNGGADEVATEVHLTQEDSITDSPDHLDSVRSLESFLNDGHRVADTPVTELLSPPLLLHHRDAFDTQNDVSNHGNNDRDGQNGHEDHDNCRDKNDSANDERVDEEHTGGADEVVTDFRIAQEDPIKNSPDHLEEGDSDDSPDKDECADDGHVGGADEVANDVRLAQEDPITDSPDHLEYVRSSEAFLDDGHRVADAPTPKLSPQCASFGLDGGSSENEEGVAGPEVVLDDMLDRQVAQFQRFAPIHWARGSMWGTLNDITNSSENLSTSSTSSLSESPDEARQDAEKHRSNVTVAPEQSTTTTDILVPKAPEDSTQNPLPSPIRAVGPPFTGIQGSRYVLTASTPAIDGQEAAKQPPSNHFPGMENAIKTHDEEVGDALSEYVRENATKTLGDSMWAPKPDAKAREVHRQARSMPIEKSPHGPIQSEGKSGTRAAPWNSSPNFSDPTTLQSPANTLTALRNGISQFSSGVRSDGALATSPQSNHVAVMAKQPPLSNDRVSPPSVFAKGAGSTWRGQGGSRGGRGTPRLAAHPKSENSAQDSFRRLQERLAREAEK